MRRWSAFRPPPPRTRATTPTYRHTIHPALAGRESGPVCVRQPITDRAERIAFGWISVGLVRLVWSGLLALDSVGMSPEWDEEYLTVNEIAEHLKLNPQTLRNWIDQNRLPAVRIGRRVRVRRTDLDRILAEGATAAVTPSGSTVAPTDAVEELAEALERARRLLGRRSATRRDELAEGLQDLTDAVAKALHTLSDDAGQPASE